MAENQLILIADDFGQSPGISTGILVLLKKGRLSGTSALVNMPDFITSAPDLAKFAGLADLGLHLNLTAGSPLTRMRHFAPDSIFPTLPHVMKNAWLRRLDRAEIALEIKAQIQQFKTHMGFLPHFIDGHQHVHICPVIRDALCDALKTYSHFQPWLRSPYDNPIRIIRRGVMVRKSLILTFLSMRFHRVIRTHGYETNSSFSGASDFNPLRNYNEDFALYLRHASASHLVMCHPGYVASDDKFPDRVRETRPLELEFLMSDQFLLCLKEAKLKLGRMPRRDERRSIAQN